jgi:hypothetical protein
MQIKSASELRATWPEMSDDDKLKAAQLMYGNGAEAAVQLLNKALGDTEAPVDEILGFARHTPKRTTVKKNKEKFDEPTVADKIAARRKAAAKGDKNAWSSKKELNVAEDGTAEIAAMAAVAGLAAPVMTAIIKGAFKTGKGLLKVKKIADQAGVKLSDKIIK